MLIRREGGDDVAILWCGVTHHKWKECREEYTYRRPALPGVGLTAVRDAAAEAATRRGWYVRPPASPELPAYLCPRHHPAPVPAPEADGPTRRVADDYGEPWAPMYGGDAGWEFVVDRDGRAAVRMTDGPFAAFGPARTRAEQERVRLRVVRCVNLLSGVPDAVLADPAAMARVWAELAAPGGVHPVATPACAECGDTGVASPGAEYTGCPYCYRHVPELPALPARAATPSAPRCPTCKDAGEVEYQERGEYGKEWMTRTCPDCRPATRAATPAAPRAPSPPAPKPPPVCPACQGRKGRMNPTGGYRELSGTYPQWEDCPACNGSGAGRTRAQVLAARGTVVGCCNRHADNHACSCLANAVISD